MTEINIEFCKKCQYYNLYEEVYNVTIGGGDGKPFHVRMESCNKEKERNWTIEKGEEIPSWCPYTLEQIVLEQTNA